MNFSKHLLVDFQPYLLPGTDPWALSVEKALGLLNYLSTKGFKCIYCTPPVKCDSRFSTANAIRNVFSSFRQSYSWDCELKLAARYRLDDGFIPLVNHGELLSIGEYLIIDVSPLQAHVGTSDMIKATIEAGYTPILAQPERTVYWEEEDFLRLKEAGCKFMLNLYSLFGYNGDYALMYSRWMLSEGMYDYACSGMEDTKIMHYSERFALDEDDTIIKALRHITIPEVIPF